MYKFNNETAQKLIKVLSRGLTYNPEFYYAIAFPIISDDKKKKYVSESEHDYESAAEDLWRMLNEDEVDEIVENLIVFIHDGECWFTEELFGYIMHSIFDHGKVSFIEAMWYDLGRSIMDVERYQSFCNDEWSLSDAVKEFINLQQTGPSELLPWDLADNYEFISQELSDIINSPRF